MLFKNIFFSIILTYTESETALEGVFWEVKPFIFKAADGSIDGIIPQIFRQGHYYCEKENYELINFTTLLPSRRSYLDLLYSKKKYGENELANISQDRAIWFPDDTFMDARDHEKFRGLRSFQLFKSDGIAVIVPRYMISLPNKMLRGILSCRQILVLILMLALLFGVAIWVAEVKSNNEFSKFFVQGTINGIWWSVVSMTTVGYGDIVPKSVFGRLIASVWMFISVILGCLMTATVTEVITSVTYLDIYKKEISVVRSSYEFHFAKKVYGAFAIPVESYESALSMVRSGKVFAALINADVTAWLQEEIENDNNIVPLRVVKILPATLYVNCLISTNLSEAAKKAFNCMAKHSDEVYTQSVEHFRKNCHTDTLHIDSVLDMFQKSSLYQILLGLIFVCACFGLAFDQWTKRKKKNRNEIEMENSENIHHCGQNENESSK